MPENDVFNPTLEEEFDASQEFQNEDEVNAPEYAAEGIYHLGIQTVDASGKNSPGAVFFTFEILEGNVANQIGKVIRWPLWPPSPKAKDQAQAKKRWWKTVLRLMLATGLRKAGEFPKVTPSAAWWESLEGKQLIARVSHVEQKQTTEAGKDVKWINAVIASRDDMFAFGSKEVVDVPVNKEALAVGGYTDGLEGASTEGI